MASLVIFILHNYVSHMQGLCQLSYSRQAGPTLVPYLPFIKIQFCDNLLLVTSVISDSLSI